MTAEKRSLHTKLAQIMYEAERIPKNGQAPREMGGYRFVQVGDAADYIRKALAEQKITMLPTSVQVVGMQDRPTKSGGSMTTVDLLMEWTLTDGDSGESVTIMSFGAGADGGDKYSGKASTSAMKYALLTGFLLSTGDDSEAHATPETAAPGARPAPPRLPARVDPNETDPVPSPEPYTETEEIIGRERRRGIIRKGSAEGYKLDARIGPEGHTIGFRLETSKGNIPQCIVAGPLGEMLYLATSEHPDSLIGKPATVAGILYHVKGPNGSWYRLKVDRIETDEWILPADPERDAAAASMPNTPVMPPLSDEPALPEPPADIELAGEGLGLG